MLAELAESGEIDEQIYQDTKESLMANIEAEAENGAKAMKQLEGEAEVLDKEIKRLKALKDAKEATAKRIKTEIENAMRETGKTKFKTELFSFGIQKNPASLKLADNLDFDTVPAEFIVFSAPSIDKEAVKKAIKDGAEFEWAQMVQSEGLRIK